MNTSLHATTKRMTNDALLLCFSAFFADLGYQGVSALFPLYIVFALHERVYWHGVTHQVTVVEGGVLYRGQCHRSLSRVARLITGSRWSGPTFFGLKAKGSRQQHDAP